MVIFLDSISKKEDYILKLVDHYDFLTSYSLPYLFKHKPNRYIYMKKLVEKGLLDFVKYPKFKLWFLTDIGKKYISQKRGRFQDTFNLTKIQQDNIEHTITAANLEINLNQKYKKTKDISDYTPNKYLQNDKKKQDKLVPDSEFTYLGKYKIAFELGIKKRSKQKYQEDFKKYFSQKKYQRVYWLYTNKKEKEKIINSFRETWKKQESNSDTAQINVLPGVHVCANLKDVLEHGLDTAYIPMNTMKK